MTAVPHLVSLTIYSDGVAEFLERPFDDLARDIKAGRGELPLGTTFQLHEIADAHRCMGDNRAGEKIVVTT